MISYTVQNIIDLMESLGEEAVNDILSGFSCPINPEIESFVRNKSIDFAKRKISITYLLLDSAYKVLAIFTLTHKAISIDTDTTSGTFRKKVARYAEIDNDTGKYTVSAFLIAQFGKNMSPEIEGVPSGTELMVCAMKALLKARHMIGGGVVYLECEDKPALLHFYQNESNKFQPFGTRTSIQDNTNYIQLLRFF